MQKKYFIYGAMIVIVLVGFYIWNMKTTYSPVVSDRPTTSAGSESLNPATNTNQNNSTSTPSTFTLEEVAKHNSAASCYAAINGNVYDLTTWINRHPGGRLKILAICGRDGSTVFNLQHGGDPKPNATLATFKIGTLGQ